MINHIDDDKYIYIIKIRYIYIMLSCVALQYVLYAEAYELT